MISPADLPAFCRLALQSRVSARSKTQTSVLLPSSVGVSRLDIETRLHVHYRITWTRAQVTAVVDELVRLGGARLTNKGYQAADWSIIERLANGPDERAVEGEEVPA